jgi:hypothetical protein
MRRQALRLADAEIDRGLAEIDRQQLRMNVGDMQQRDVAERVELQELVLCQPLLRQRARRQAGHHGRGRRPDLQKLAAGNHDRASFTLIASEAKQSSVAKLLDCVVACAPRNDALHLSAESPVRSS